MRGEKVLVVDDAKEKLVLPDGSLVESEGLSEPAAKRVVEPPKIPAIVTELLAHGISCVRCHVRIGQLKGSPIRRFEDPFKGYVCRSCLAETKSHVEAVRAHTGRKYGVLTDPLRKQLLEPVPVKASVRKRPSRAKKEAT